MIPAKSSRQADEEQPSPELPPEWYRHGLLLHERSVPETSRIPPEALAEARERARRWQQSSGLDEEAFRFRVETAGLDWDRFVQILAAQEAKQAPAAKDPGAYDEYRVLEEIRLGTHAEVVLPTVTWNNPDGSRGTEPPFGSFLRPFLQGGVARLRRGVADIEAPAAGQPPLFDSSAEIHLFLDLIQRLTKQASSTLILELHVARLKGQLEGDTSNERFRHFSERFFTPAKVLEMLEEYPVLARLLALTVCRWSAVTLEFLSRLAADRAALGELGSSAGPLGTLTSVRLGISDPHRGGRAVVIAEDGDGRKVVYKPTSLAVDVAMQRLVEAVNGLGLRHPLRTVRVADRGDERGEYGWLEHIETRGCETADQLHRFYWRQGCWIALLHLVRGADFHHENLLACGEHPVLVDHEALFHHARPWEATPKTPRQEGAVVLSRSVLRQALLPFIYRLTAKGEGVDSSGLGGAGGQVARGSVRRWAEPGTDQMYVAEADMVTQESQNRPSLQGNFVEASDYLPDIVEGFRETYDLLASRRDALRPLLDGFAGTKVRYLVRPTRLYTVFLREGYHPNDLLDGLDRDELLDRLWAWAAAIPELLRVIPYEHADLSTGDVPVFSAQPEATHLWSSGGERIDGFFTEPSLTDAHRVLDGLSEEDRDWQTLLIRMTVSEARSRAGTAADGGPGGERGADRPGAPSHETETGGGEPHNEELDDAELEAAAVRVGELLKRRALAGEHGVGWISLDPFVDDRPGEAKPRNITVAGEDLYHGSAGIALFLAYLGAITGDEEATELARGSVRGLLAARAALDPAVKQVPGAVLGRASDAYLLQHLAALWGEPRWLETALADLPSLEALIAEDEELDLLAGSAGSAVVALQLYRATGDPEALRVARAAGDHLLAQAQSTRGGLGWTGRSFGRPVAGFAHGAAGIAWALFELAAVTGDERYRDAALAAVAFERHLLASSEGESFHARVSWCHGLPSVAVGRVLAAGWLDDSAVRGEIEAGARRILEHRAPADLCLCHGALGNAEILALCGRQNGVGEWERQAGVWAARAAREIRSLEHDLLLPLHGRFAGLLCGLAGLGWGLLRFAHPEAVPSVLTLDPPLRRESGP